MAPAVVVLHVLIQVLLGTGGGVDLEGRRTFLGPHAIHDCQLASHEMLGLFPAGNGVSIQVACVKTAE